MQFCGKVVAASIVRCCFVGVVYVSSEPVLAVAAAAASRRKQKQQQPSPKPVLEHSPEGATCYPRGTPGKRSRVVSKLLL